MRTKAEVLGELRTMLRDIFVAKSQGETHARLARAHGYVDGYMRGLLETGTATKHELLELVANERERVSGPAMRPLSVVSDGESAGAPKATPSESNCATLEQRVDKALHAQKTAAA